MFTFFIFYFILLYLDDFHCSPTKTYVRTAWKRKNTCRIFIKKYLQSLKTKTKNLSFFFKVFTAHTATIRRKEREGGLAGFTGSVFSSWQTLTDLTELWSGKNCNMILVSVSLHHLLVPCLSGAILFLHGWTLSFPC